MSSPSQSAVPEADVSSRGSLGLLLICALGWLAVAAFLALVSTIQLHTPSFLNEFAVLTHGRLDAMRETAFLYGWGANAAILLSLWLLSSLGSTPLRGPGLLTAGTLFWNFTVLAALVCIACGEGTTIRYLEIPAYLQPILLISWGAMATPGILAWTGRRSDTTYAAQWYALAPLFLFPWLFSAAMVMLFWSPVHGVAQAVVAGWYGQNVITHWLAPVALASAYYLVPKLSGRTVVHYEYAVIGFWVLIVTGAWTGGRHLVGGPVPAWISSLAIVASCLLLFHYLVVLINLSGGLLKTRGNLTLRFILVGLSAYVLGGLLDAVFSFRHPAEVVQFTFFTVAQSRLLWSGAFTFLIFGGLYELGPRITGIAWPSTGLIRAHFGAALLGMLGVVIGFAAAGLAQGQAQADAANSYAVVAAAARPGLLIATAGEAVLFLAALIALVNFVRLQVAAVAVAMERPTAAVPASAS